MQGISEDCVYRSIKGAVKNDQSRGAEWGLRPGAGPASAPGLWATDAPSFDTHFLCSLPWTVPGSLYRPGVWRDRYETVITGECAAYVVHDLLYRLLKATRFN